MPPAPHKPGAHSTFIATVPVPARGDSPGSDIRSCSNLRHHRNLRKSAIVPVLAGPVQTRAGSDKRSLLQPRQQLLGLVRKMIKWDFARSHVQQRLGQQAVDRRGDSALLTGAHNRAVQIADLTFAAPGV